MKKKVLLISSPDSKDSNTLTNLAKMVDFFGLEQVDEPPDNGSSDFAIVVNQERVGALSNLPPAKAVLVYNCHENSPTFNVVKRNNGTYFHVGNFRHITKQLSGISITAMGLRNAYAFSAINSFDSLIQLDADPFFIHENRDDCHWFYLTGDNVVDLDSPISDDKFKFDIIFAEIIPFAMFFQFIRGGVTHNKYANLIIDDPSLSHRYGFIDYELVAKILVNNDLALTIAFIPWNYRKSQWKTVDLFAANQDRLSICVHGCDHTSGEFATTDVLTLNWKVSLARKRMEEHKAKFGLPYDNTIVFPQGAFSVESMRVLQHHGFTAAVNSSIIACNYHGGLKIRDLIVPATTHYGLPLFLRRYPKRFEDFAFDLFMGRPVLIVQHSVDFAEGWDSMLSLISQINALEPNLQWMPLGKLVEQIGLNIRATVGDRVAMDGTCGYTLKSYFKTSLRRHLCDIRDNIVYRNDVMRNFITKHKKTNW